MIEMIMGPKASQAVFLNALKLKQFVGFNTMCHNDS